MQQFSTDTHVLVTKDGHEEYMAKTSWENTKAAGDGSRDGYHLVASTPPEVVAMQQIKEIASKKEVKAEIEQKEEAIAPELVAKPVVKKGKK